MSTHRMTPFSGRGTTKSEVMLKVWAHALAWRLAHPLGPATTVACKLHGRYGAPKLCWRGRVFMLPANASVRCTWMEYMELCMMTGFHWVGRVAE